MFTLGLLLILKSQIMGWDQFKDVRFKGVWVDELDTAMDMPVFGSDLKKLEGTEIELTGYFMPIDLDGNRIIISKLPFAACFFCGGVGGLETVAEIEFDNVQRPFRTDELVTVRGTLVLNESDFERLVFILENSTLK